MKTHILKILVLVCVVFALQGVLFKRVKFWCVYFSPLHKGGELGQLLTKAKISQNTVCAYDWARSYFSKQDRITQHFTLHQKGSSLKCLCWSVGAFIRLESKFGVECSKTGNLLNFFQNWKIIDVYTLIDNNIID